MTLTTFAFSSRWRWLFPTIKSVAPCAAGLVCGQVMNANRSPRPSFTRSSSKQKVSPSGARASRVTQRSETFVVTNPTTVREKLYALFEDPSSGYWAKKLAGTILILILISIVSFIGETMLWVEQFIPPNGW